jgi:hypothetical protein
MARFTKAPQRAQSEGVVVAAMGFDMVHDTRRRNAAGFEADTRARHVIGDGVGVASSQCNTNDGLQDGAAWTTSLIIQCCA